MINWQSVAAVFAGGGAGSVLRLLITFAVTQRYGPGFPWPTMLINITGSFAIGVLAELALTRANAGTPLVRLFFMTGVLGGYTTFSTFSFDALQLIGGRAVLLAVAYIAGSVILGVIAAFGGVALARSI
ncbi:MAG: CrcB family protein [Candidatus Baltobacteraceae bacterium]